MKGGRGMERGRDGVNTKGGRERESCNRGGDVEAPEGIPRRLLMAFQNKPADQSGGPKNLQNFLSLAPVQRWRPLMRQEVEFYGQGEERRRGGREGGLEHQRW